MWFHNSYKTPTLIFTPLCYGGANHAIERSIWALTIVQGITSGYTLLHSVTWIENILEQSQYISEKWSKCVFSDIRNLSVVVINGNTRVLNFNTTCTFAYMQAGCRIPPTPALRRANHNISTFLILSSVNFRGWSSMGWDSI